VYPVDLPVDRPDLTAREYAQLTAEQCGRHEAPIVVGHSAAGLLLPVIGRELGAARLVWLSAVVPDPGGRSFTEEVEALGDTMFGAEWLALREPPTVDPLVAAYFLFHDCPLQTLRWALTTLRPFVPCCRVRRRR
jgi:hypothetical protein